MTEILSNIRNFADQIKQNKEEIDKVKNDLFVLIQLFNKFSKFDNFKNAIKSCKKIELSISDISHLKASIADIKKCWGSRILSELLDLEDCNLDYDMFFKLLIDKISDINDLKSIISISNCNNQCALLIDLIKNHENIKIQIGEIQKLLKDKSISCKVSINACDINDFLNELRSLRRSVNEISLNFSEALNLRIPSFELPVLRHIATDLDNLISKYNHLYRLAQENKSCKEVLEAIHSKFGSEEIKHIHRRVQFLQDLVNKFSLKEEINCKITINEKFRDIINECIEMLQKLNEKMQKIIPEKLTEDELRLYRELLEEALENNTRELALTSFMQDRYKRTADSIELLLSLCNKGLVDCKLYI